MPSQLISIKCPECGATLSIEDGRKQAFCSYCGTKILLDNGRDYEYTYRQVNEADIKRAETEQLVRLKELDLEEKAREAYEKSKSIRLKLTLLIIAIGILLMIVGEVSHSTRGLAPVGMVVLFITPFVWIGHKRRK